MEKLNVASMIKLFDQMTKEERIIVAKTINKKYCSIDVILNMPNFIHKTFVVTYNYLEKTDLSIDNIAKKLIDTDFFYQHEWENKKIVPLFHPIQWSVDWKKSNYIMDKYSNQINRNLFQIDNYSQDGLNDIAEDKLKTFVTPTILHDMYGPNNYKEFLNTMANTFSSYIGHYKFEIIYDIRIKIKKCTDTKLFNISTYKCWQQPTKDYDDDLYYSSKYFD